MTTTTTRVVISELKKIFATWGFPDVIMCDNGTQFVSADFKRCAIDYDCVIERSSQRYPQSNGGAENNVKQAKKILDQKDPISALMAYRATPTTITGYSPSDLLQGRGIKTFLPVPPESLVPKLPDSEKLTKKHQKAKHDQKKHFDKRNGVLDLKELKPGDQVRIRAPYEKTWGPESRIVKNCGIRSYLVDTGNGSVHRQIQLIPPMSVLPSQNAPPNLPQMPHSPRENRVQEPQQPVHPQPEQPQPEQPIELQQAGRRYPTRERRPPQHLTDYVLYT